MESRYPVKTKRGSGIAALGIGIVAVIGGISTWDSSTLFGVVASLFVTIVGAVFVISGLALLNEKVYVGNNWQRGAIRGHRTPLLVGTLGTVRDH